MDNYQLELEVTLRNVNYIQNVFKDIKRAINSMKEELSKAGFRVEFDSTPFDNRTIRCSVFKKGSKELIVKQDATVAEGDYPVRLLGEYLSLARATRIILGDYNDN